jgi:hypothetical protein
MKKLILALLGLVILPGVNAALVVDSFSCNEQTVSVNVVNAENMNCQAIILNNDPSESKAINEVSLVVSGTWAEQNSYSVAVNTNLGAGQSTQVTFQGIRSTTPGNEHKFLSIDIDSVSHTEEVESTSINAVAIKSLTVSADSSASTGSEFDVNSYVTVGGDFGNVDLAISLSGGCSVSAGESATKSIGPMSHNGQASRSWKVTQGSSNCGITVTATGTASPVTTTKTKSVTVTNPSAVDEGNGGTAGTGGGGGAAAQNATSNETVAKERVAETGKVSEEGTGIEEKVSEIPGEGKTKEKIPVSAELESTMLIVFIALAVAVILAVVALKRVQLKRFKRK